MEVRLGIELGTGLCVASLVAAGGACAPASRPVSAGDTGIFPMTSSSTGSGSDGSGGATGDTSGSSEDDCRDDADCGDLRCIDGACYGCMTRDDCPADQQCLSDYCRDVDDVPLCVGLEAPVCGDGVIGALEECDGGPECDDCSRTVVSQTWIAASEQVSKIVPTADGGGVAIRNDDPELLVRYDEAGSAVWSIELEHAVNGLAVDAAGNTYVAGRRALEDQAIFAAWIMAVAVDGTPTWSVEENAEGGYGPIDVEGARVLVGGSTEQSNSPWRRGVVALYAVDGALIWSQKLAGYEHVTAAVFVDGEAAVLVEGFTSLTGRTLLRLDDTGALRWSVDVVPIDTGYPYGPRRLVHDGAGGTWIAGEDQEGPWAVRHDRDGRELERLDCIGSTAGDTTHFAVGPAGQLAIAVLVTDGPVAVADPTPWIAVMDAGTITAASVIEQDAGGPRLFALAWHADGRLVVGLEELDPEATRVVVLEP
jgi:hypothetical protein